MKNWICTDNSGHLSYRKPTAEEEYTLLAVPKDKCTHQLVHRESGFTTDEIVCSVCGTIVAIFGS